MAQQAQKLETTSIQRWFNANASNNFLIDVVSTFFARFDVVSRGYKLCHSSGKFGPWVVKQIFLYIFPKDPYFGILCSSLKTNMARS